MNEQVVERLKRKGWFIKSVTRQECMLVLQACDEAGLRWAVFSNKATEYIPFKNEPVKIGYEQGNAGLTQTCSNYYENEGLEDITDWFFFNMNKTDKTMKILIPASGGIDSTYLLMKAIKEYGKDNVTAMFMDEHRLNFQQQVENLCKHLGIEFVTMPMPELDKIAMPTHPLSIQNGTDYWIGYKTYMYVNCLAYGTAHGIDEIWFGVYSWNNQFVDVLPQSGRKLQEVWRQLYPDVKCPNLKFPLIGSNKALVIEEGFKMQLPFELTYSCFEHNEDTLIHCGKCLACKDRKASFKHAIELYFQKTHLRLLDPTVYE